MLGVPQAGQGSAPVPAAGAADGGRERREAARRTGARRTSVEAAGPPPKGHAAADQRHSGLLAFHQPPVPGRRQRGACVGEPSWGQAAAAQLLLAPASTPSCAAKPAAAAGVAQHAKPHPLLHHPLCCCPCGHAMPRTPPPPTAQRWQAPRPCPDTSRSAPEHRQGLLSLARAVPAPAGNQGVPLTAGCPPHRPGGWAPPVPAGRARRGRAPVTRLPACTPALLAQALPCWAHSPHQPCSSWQAIP